MAPLNRKHRFMQTRNFLTLVVAALTACTGAGCHRSNVDGARAALVRPRADLVLPAVRLHAGKSRPAGPLYKKDFLFTEDWFTPEIPIWEAVFAPYKSKPMQHYLEIGVFEGRSVLWMLETILTDPTSRVVAIDPFLGDYKERYYANLAKSGFQSRVTTIAGYSQIELRKQPLGSFDIIYLDGSHAAGDVLEDAVLCLRLLKPGGIMIFDDYQWTGWNRVEPSENTPRAAVDVFYAVYGKQFEVIHNGYQVILRKK